MCEVTFHSVCFNNWWNYFWLGRYAPFWEALMLTSRGGSQPSKFFDTITALLHLFNIGQILSWNCTSFQPHHFSIDLRSTEILVHAANTWKLHLDLHSWTSWANGQIKNHEKKIGHFPTWFFTLLLQTVITSKCLDRFSCSWAELVDLFKSFNYRPYNSKIDSRKAESWREKEWKPLSAPQCTLVKPV